MWDEQICQLADLEFQVIPKVGLCICMYDLLKASDGLIGNGNGNVNVNGECMIGGWLWALNTELTWSWQWNFA